ncbi:hypothetical protein V2J09_013883 [Rumex salicifolius]
MAMASAMRTTISPMFSAKLLFRHRQKLVCSYSPSSSMSSSNGRKLILYSKPGCCLCDGLKEKLNAAFSLVSSPLHDLDLEVRDITTNPDWENAYQYEIPVLAKLCSDGSEERLPRLSPRLSVEMIQKKVVDAFSQQ